MLIVGLFCKDFYYRKRLSEILMEKGQDQFYIYSFSEQEKLIRFAEETKFDILLIEEEAYICLKEHMLLDNMAKHYLVLCELASSDMESDWKAASYVSKYSTVGDLIHKIKSFVPREEKGGCKIIGIASQVHGCGKTSFAYELCEQLQEKGNTLLIVLDDRNPVFTSSKKGLSRIMYEFCKSSDFGEFSSLNKDALSLEEFTILINENVKKFDEITYIPASDSKYEMDMIQDAHISTLFTYLRASKIYNYVVIDFSEQLLYGNSVRSCDLLFIPTKKDCLSDYYTRVFKEYVGPSHEVILPYVRNMTDFENYYRELQWSSLGGMTKQIIGEFAL